ISTGRRGVAPRRHRRPDDGSRRQRRGSEFDSPRIPRLIRAQGKHAMSSIARKAAGVTAVTAAIAAAYLLFWPVPAEPVSWQAPTPPGYTGAHALNTRLSGLRRIDIGAEFGPEHIAIGPDGMLYAAMTSGNLLRMAPGGENREVFANTGGR